MPASAALGTAVGDGRGQGVEVGRGVAVPGKGGRTVAVAVGRGIRPGGDASGDPTEEGVAVGMGVTVAVGTGVEVGTGVAVGGPA